MEHGSNNGGGALSLLGNNLGGMSMMMPAASYGMGGMMGMYGDPNNEPLLPLIRTMTRADSSVYTVR
jgi:hypothetical protein